MSAQGGGMDIQDESRVMPEPNSGCMLWLGAISQAGYATLGKRLVHRLVYEARIAPIPPKWVIDHLCRNRACVNERHLEATTQRTNIRLGKAPAIVTANTDICARGHVGHMVPKGDYRVCRECVLMGKRAYRARHRERLREKDQTYYHANAPEIIKRTTTYQVGYRKRRTEAR